MVDYRVEAGGAAAGHAGAAASAGQERFRIYCTPCHSELGDGHGMVVQRGFPAPPSYHIARLREAPVQHFYDVITNGYGAMYSFAYRVQPADRWAIAAYIRALQRSQDATRGGPDARAEGGAAVSAAIRDWRLLRRRAPGLARRRARLGRSNRARSTAAGSPR